MPTVAAASGAISEAMPPPADAGWRVAVVGGGITGLAAAYFLQRAGADVTLVEAGDRLGGKIRTQELEGVPVEAGPDTFLARVPDAVELCRELGLGNDLVAPATGKAFLFIGGRLRPLPERHVLGVPTALGPVLRSGVLSRAGVARAALDVVLPRSRFGDDPSVAEVVGRRMGRQVVDRLVDPLVGGIHAGRADRLSLASTARPLADAAASSRSLALALRSRPAGPTSGPEGPVFLAVAGGLERLVDRLRQVLTDKTDIRVATAVTGLDRTEAGWRVACRPGPPVEVDACIVTTPAPLAARLLEMVAPTAASKIAGIRYASVAVTSLAYQPSALPRPLEGSGYLVPRVEGRLHTACTFSTTKWPALSGSGLVLVRVSAGRDGDDRPAGLDDGELVARLHAEVADAIGATEAPVASLVTRLPGSFPQYDVGHGARVEAVDVALASAAPGVVVAGAAYRGLGIAACIGQARAAVDRLAALRPAPRPV